MPTDVPWTLRASTPRHIVDAALDEGRLALPPGLGRADLHAAADAFARAPNSAGEGYPLDARALAALHAFAEAVGQWLAADPWERRFDANVAQLEVALTTFLIGVIVLSYETADADGEVARWREALDALYEARFAPRSS